RVRGRTRMPGRSERGDWGERRGGVASTEAPRERASGAEWRAPAEPPARGEAKRDRALLDLLPTGVLIYRLDRLLYANPAFLQRIGYESLHELEHAGGLDALYVDTSVSSTSSTSEAGTPVVISADREGSPPSTRTEARLFTISWDGDSALALIFATNDSILTALVEPAVAPMASWPAVARHANHGLRTPSSDVVGFAETTIDEQSGALDNERYLEPLMDTRTSGE